VLHLLKFKKLEGTFTDYRELCKKLLSGVIC
jgi:hypothetical protein